MISITQFETLNAQLPAPRSQDPLDGTEGELRRLTRHLLTLMLKYQGRSWTPRGLDDHLCIGIVGDTHTVTLNFGARYGVRTASGVTITDPLGRQRHYRTLLSQTGFDRLMAGVRRALRFTACHTWTPTETVTTALEAAPPGDGWRLAYITLVPGSLTLRTYTWSRVRVALPPDPRKSDFLRSFDAALSRISDSTLAAHAQRELRRTPIGSPDFAQIARAL